MTSFIGHYFIGDSKNRWVGQVLAGVDRDHDQFLVELGDPVRGWKGERRVVGGYEMRNWRFFGDVDAWNGPLAAAVQAWNDAPVDEKAANILEFLRDMEEADLDKEYAAERLYKAWQEWKAQKTAGGEQQP